MEESFPYDTATIRHQFDCLCKKSLKNEMIDHQRQRSYRYKHEILLSELSQKELDRLFTTDEYSLDTYRFQVLGYNIEVKDILLADALQSLSERKRDVILLYYYMDMTEAEIAHEMKLVRSTIHEHRKRSLELLKQKMKGYDDEE